MQRRTFVASAIGTCLYASSGCGTLLHPERRGQPHSHQIDWKVAALDGLGLILFFVPGVVAFAVDFYTGAIYLPDGPTFVPATPSGPPGGPAYPPPGYGAAPPGYGPPGYGPPAYGPPANGPPANGPPGYGPSIGTGAANLRRVVVPREQLEPQRIEAVVAEHTGRPVQLADSATRVSPLARLERFTDQCRRHQTDREFGLGFKTWRTGWRNA